MTTLAFPLVLGLALALGDERKTPDAAPKPAPVYERVVVIGASASAGFRLQEELGARATLADFVTQAVRPAGATSFASTTLFLDPVDTGARMVESALAARPTAVIALDYLFWFGYGFLEREEDRLALLEQGLELLARFECPVVVGDFPDVSQALHGARVFGRRMLLPEQVPAPATIQRLNARLRAWAAGRGKVAVAPIADFLGRLRSGEEFELRGNRFDAASLREMLQADLLHPTGRGTAALAVLALDALVRGGAPEPASWEAGTLREAVWTALGPERETRAARRQEQSERRKVPEPAGTGG